MRVSQTGSDRRDAASLSRDRLRVSHGRVFLRDCHGDGTRVTSPQVRIGDCTAAVYARHVRIPLPKGQSLFGAFQRKVRHQLGETFKKQDACIIITLHTISGNI